MAMAAILQNGFRVRLRFRLYCVPESDTCQPVPRRRGGPNT